MTGIINETYPDYRSAAATCGPGYLDHDISKVVAFKTADYSTREPNVLLNEQSTNTLLAVGVAAGDLSTRPLHVLDFGGGCGFHYFTAKNPFKVAMRWAVVETPTMAAQAKTLSSGQFEVYDTIDQAVSSLGRVDLVHTSGAIQCVPDPMATLDALIAIRASYLALARFPVWRGSLSIGVQTSLLSENGIGPMPPGLPDRRVRYPILFPDIDATLARFKQDYDLIISLPSPSASYVVRGQNVPGVTVIFRAK
jgi:putative methyltransferase (TIGR04325 family)